MKTMTVRFLENHENMKEDMKILIMNNAVKLLFLLWRR